MASLFCKVTSNTCSNDYEPYHHCVGLFLLTAMQTLLLFFSLAIHRLDFLRHIVVLSGSSLLSTPPSLPSLIEDPTNHHETSITTDQRPWSLDTTHFTWQSQYIRKKIMDEIAKDPTLAGPLIRLAFHDATTFEYGPRYIGSEGKVTVMETDDFSETRQQRNKISTGGPNGSIRYELDRYENRALKRPLQVVQDIVDNLEAIGTNSNRISLADAIALSGAAAVEASGGPPIHIRMGRADASSSDPERLRHPLKKDSKRSEVTNTMPSAGLDSVGLRLYFGRLGLSESEFVALSGVHGLGRHVSLLNMTKDCLKNLTQICLEDAPVLLPFVTESVDHFDNSYFTALLRWNAQQVKMGEVAFIPTDVALVVDNGLRRHVEAFSDDKALYYRTFRRAYQKLVDTTATTKGSY